MGIAEAALTALQAFRNEVLTWTNQGSIVSIEGHIAQIEHAVGVDARAGELAAKAVLADLYGAFHGQAVAPLADVSAPDAPALAAPYAAADSAVPSEPSSAASEPAAADTVAAPGA